MNVDINNIIAATPAENVMWNSMKKFPHSLSNTLSFELHISAPLSPEEIQSAIYKLLTVYCPLFLYQFFEHKAVLMKRMQEPSLHPVRILPNPKKAVKKIFHINDSSLYMFQWQNLGNSSILEIHLSHLIFDGSCYSDLCVALTKAFDSTIKPNSKFLKLNKKEPNLEFWKEYVKDKLLFQPLPFLPHECDRGKISTQLIITKDLFHKLKIFSKNKQFTFFQIIMSAVSILLHHYTKYLHQGENDICLSYTASCREKGEPIGCYLQVLPLIICCLEEHTPYDILSFIKTQRQQHRLTSGINFSELISLIDFKLNHQQSLFNVIVNHSPGLLPLDGPTINGFDSRVFAIDPEANDKSLSISYNFNEEMLLFLFESNHGHYAQEVLEQFANNFLKTLEFILDNTTASIKQCEYSTKIQACSVGRQLAVTNLMLPEILLANAKKYHQKTAIQTEKYKISYANLISFSNEMKKRMVNCRKNQLQKGLGLFLTRDYYYPATLFFCTIESIQFVPLSTEMPEEAIYEIIVEKDLDILIVDKLTKQRLINLNKHCQLIEIEDCLKIGNNQGNDYDYTIGSTERQFIAYTLFTSGSTGKPKGVMVSYDNVMNYFKSVSHYPGFTHHDTILALTPVSFDISITELLLPFYTGGSLYLIDEITRKDSKKLAEIIKTNDISVIQATPSSFQLLKNASWKSEKALNLWIGGELISPLLAEYLLKQNHNIFNMYGPTEATIWAAACKIEQGTPIYIAGPVDNSELYIVDERGNTPPYGIPGELVIGGQCVALGYSNHTNDAFIKLENGVNAYYTGDIVNVFGQDKIQFLKRKDEQVKLNGHRVELQEIQYKIQQIFPQIEVAVIIKELPEPHLICFYTGCNPDEIDIAHLIATLKVKLPIYKIPQGFVYLPHFPLTANNKINKKALNMIDPLKQPNFSKIINKQQTNLLSLEITKLISLIRDHFGIDIDENQTLQSLGFNSLSYIKFSSLIEKEFSFSFSPHLFYTYDSISTIVQYIHNEFNLIQNNGDSSNQTLKRKRIAIIGFDCIMPNGYDAIAFWNALIQHEDLIHTHNRSWLKLNTKAGYIKGIEQFDRKFFNISPLEASRMDPRQRLLLQCAWRTIEHGGYSAESLRGSSISCFIAATANDYVASQIKDEIKSNPYTLSGNAANMLSNRLSYFFDWKGTSLTIDTACSSSLIALIRAIDQINFSDNQMAFVGAANLITDHFTDDALRAGNFLSPNNRCASFSDGADGYVRGEGVIGFLLKSLDSAEEDGDTIYAVIESVSENHGGHAHSLTAPNSNAQYSMLKNAYQTPFSPYLSYIETHGTGTRLGDPIEIDALKTFREHHLDINHPKIFLGSVKSNIGHLEAAAGLASLLKVIMSMQNKLIPANIHFSKLNPLIELNSNSFEVIAENIPWNSEILVAGISSFGFGGTNAHIVISNQFKSNSASTKIAGDDEYLFVISAKSPRSMNARINQLKNDLCRLQTQIELKDIAYTLAMGRNHFKEHRMAYIASSREALLSQLESHTLLMTHPNATLLKYGLQFLNGENVNFKDIFPKKIFKRAPLTPYQFDEQYYWHHSDSPSFRKFDNLLSLISFSEIEPFTFSLTIDSNHPFLTDHQVFKNNVLPGVAQIELALLALKHAGIFIKNPTLSHFQWIKPVSIYDSAIRLIIKIKPNNTSYLIEILNITGEVYSSGLISSTSNLYLPNMWLENLKQKLNSNNKIKINAKNIYRQFSSLGIDYGPYFQGIEYVEVSDNVAFAKLNPKMQHSLVCLLDSAFQAGMAISLNNSKPGLMPFTLGAMTQIIDFDLHSLHVAHVYTEKLSPFRTHLLICNEQDIPLFSFVDLGVKASNLTFNVNQNVPI